MSCPPTTAEVLLRILQTGLLRIRNRSWENEANACGYEADHLHNLPSLLSDYSPERLIYYWQVERPCFADQSGPEGVAAFRLLWERLEKLLPSETAASSAAAHIRS
jgi:hypothetical protein